MAFAMHVGPLFGSLPQPSLHDVRRAILDAVAYPSRRYSVYGGTVSQTWGRFAASFPAWRGTPGRWWQ